MKKNNLSAIIIPASVLILTIGLSFSGHALAQTMQIIPSPDQLGDLPATRGVSIAMLIAQVFRIMLSLAGGVFLIILLFGGFTYMSAGGNDEGTTKAKKIMVNAVVGLIITVASYGIGSWILHLLGYNFF